VHIRHRDPDGVIAILGSDHHIADIEKFRRALAASHELASQGYIVTMGISPSFPSTGFGYIKRGDPLAEVGEFVAYHAAQFTEKPDLDTAIQFLSAGLYSWNSGMFILKAGTVMDEFARQQPEMAALFEQIDQAIGREDEQPVLERVWDEMKRISLDYAVMEAAQNMAVIPVDIGWSDIGSWATLFEVLDGDLHGNVSRGSGHDHIKIDTKETLIVSDRMVVTIGIEYIVIVDTEDVLLVCHRDRSQDVRQVVSQLKAAGRDAHL
jgi:mannose-1-phosphate guanylyltransferase